MPRVGDIHDALTGGGTALDGTSVAVLVDGDVAFVVYDSGEIEFYKFNAPATDAENTTVHPYKVRPDDYATAGVWEELISPWLSVRDTAGTSFLDIMESEDDGALLVVSSDANRHLIVTDSANRTKDHDHSSLAANPTLYIHSVTNPDTNNTQYLELYHNQVDGIMGVGSGFIRVIDPVSIRTADLEYPTFIGNNSDVFNLGGVVVSGSDLQHASIDSGTSAGDLVLLVSGTGATPGMYRILSVGFNQITVDRAPGGAGTDIVCRIFKDVITFSATDGTNGQRIAGYSHQDKPLQISGDVLTATGHSLGAEDTLFGGKIEVNGAAFFDNTITLSQQADAAGITIYGYDDESAENLDLFIDNAGNSNVVASGELITDCTVMRVRSGTDTKMTIFATGVRIEDDVPILFGSSSDVQMLWETADANAEELIIAMPEGSASRVPVMVVGDTSIIGADLGWFNGQTIPRIAMVAADAGGYFSFGVNNSDILDILATTSPVVEVDETKFSHKLQCTINGSTYYLMLTAT